MPTLYLVQILPAVSVHYVVVLAIHKLTVVCITPHIHLQVI